MTAPLSLNRLGACLCLALALLAHLAPGTAFSSCCRWALLAVAVVWIVGVGTGRR